MAFGFGLMHNHDVHTDGELDIFIEYVYSVEVDHKMGTAVRSMFTDEYVPHDSDTEPETDSEAEGGEMAHDRWNVTIVQPLHKFKTAQEWLISTNAEARRLCLEADRTSK